MQKYKKYFPILLNLFLYLGIFIFSLHLPQDPDLGWHLKYGEYFFESKEVLRDNPFTQLMPNFRWNNSSWGTDLVTYQTFHNFGFIGLSVLGALTITGTFFFIGKAAKLNIFEKSLIFPLILYFTNSVNQISFRGQILSLLLLSVLYFILSKYSTNRKTILVVIPLFLFWGNLHGQYILGMAIFFIWSFVFLAKEIYLNYKKDIKNLLQENKLLLIAGVFSLLSIFVNPFGAGAYIEAIGHFDNPLQKFVVEFLPIGELSTVWWHQILVGCLMFAGLLMLGLGKKTLDKAPFYIPSLLLFFMTFWIRRYAWPFYYSSIFLLKPVVNFLKPDNEKHTLILTTIITFSFFVLALYFKFPFTDLRNYNWDKYCDLSVSCSSSAAKLIIDNRLNNEKLLTIYDYGGWLIWKYPEIKPTIDGRMHLWRDENGFSAFGYYYPIEQNWEDIDRTPYNAVLTSHSKPIFQRLLELSRQNKWRLIYNDSNSTVFLRNI